MSETFRLEYDPSKAAAGLRALVEALKKAEAAGVDLGEGVAGSISALEQAAAQAEAMAKATGDLSAKEGEAAKRTEELASKVDMLAEKAGEAKESLEGVDEQAGNTAGNTDQLNESLDGTTESAREATKGMSDLQKILLLIGLESASDTIRVFEILGKSLKDLFPTLSTLGPLLIRFFSLIKTGVLYIGPLVGIAASLKVVWDDYSESVRKSSNDLEKSNSTLENAQGWLAKVGHDALALVGIMDQYTSEIKENEKANQEWAESYAKTWAEQSKRIVAIQTLVQQFQKGLIDAAKSDAFKEQSKSLESVEKVQEKINVKQEELNLLSRDKNLMLNHEYETKERIRELMDQINTLEGRRKEIIEEQKRAEEERRKAHEQDVQAVLDGIIREQNAEQEKLKKNLETEDMIEARRKANHQKELERIRAEDDFRSQMNEDREKADEDAAKRRDEELRDKIAALEAEKKGVQDVGQARQQVQQQAAGGGAAGPGGIHGEGVAVGGNAPGPFARAFQREQQGGFFALPWQQAGVNGAAFAGIPGLDPGMQGWPMGGGGGAPAADQAPQENKLDRFVRQAREHAVNNRQSRREIIDRAMERDPNLSRRDAARQLESGDVESKELQDAIKEATQKDIELAGKKAGISKETIDVMKKKADILAEQEQEIAEIQQRLDEIAKLDDAVLRGAQRRRAQRAARGN